ncbi:dysbindin protein homolog [Euwallacea fornicatus]|uniref:dysbindin protein homolog n=1 Tax=Euwallacea fornicatus TaxID=995702 RepID=UPI00338DCFC0
MFSGIRYKLLQVKSNVSLFGSDDTSVKSQKQTALYNPQTGAPILHHFQQHWQELHALNEFNAKAAQGVSIQIENVFSRIAQSKSDIDLISHLLTSSNLTRNISKCLRQVQGLYESCKEAEGKLEQLEDMLDQQEFEQMVLRHHGHMQSYEERKLAALEKVQSALEEEYQKKVLEMESSKKLLLEERQKVFHEAFKSDLEVYKNLGTIPKVKLSKSHNGPILEEIQLDFDQSDLEQFFNEELGDSAKT